MRSNWFFGWFRPRPTPTPPPNPSPVDPPSDDILSSLLKLHNDVRGSNSLVLNDKLVAAAQKHARWMATNNRMSHTGSGGSDFSDRIKSEGYRMRTGGENVAAGYTTEKSVFNGWMNSTGHRRNILNTSFREVGFGLGTSSRGTKYWCTVFASPLTSSNEIYVHSFNNFPEPLDNEQSDIG